MMSKEISRGNKLGSNGALIFHDYQSGRKKGRRMNILQQFQMRNNILT